MKSATKRKGLFILFACAITINSVFAQKYKVSDDIITKDKVVIGKVVGVSNLMKANFQIYGVSGERVISAYREEFIAPNVLFTDRFWYNVRFEDTGKEIWLPMAAEFGVKAVLNKTFANAGIFLDGGVVKNQDEIIAKYNIADSIIRDTTYAMESHRTWRTLIKEHQIIRSRTADLTLTFLGEEKTGDKTTYEWSVKQGNVSIGRIEKKTGPALYGVWEMKFTVYEEIKGVDNVKDVPIGMGFQGPTSVSFTTIQDNKQHTIDLGNAVNPNAKIDPGKSLLSYLIARNYL